MNKQRILNYLFFSFLYFLFPQKTFLLFIKACFVKKRNKNFKHPLLLRKAVKNKAYRGLSKKNKKTKKYLTRENNFDKIICERCSQKGVKGG